jgi:hypothetical protein
MFKSKCVREKSNVAISSPAFKFDKATFVPEELKEEMSLVSPKAHKLFQHIKALDKRDMKESGKLYKHFIFCDVKSRIYGVNFLASCFISEGFTLGYDALKTPLTPKNSQDDEERYSVEHVLKSEAELLKTKNNNFYLLSSLDVYDTPIKVITKKKILSTFNKRPENVHGKLARFIIMDAGFKEGIDLFDIKYIHIFEPSVNSADQKQVIGRGTRTCGQKGLHFIPNVGWPLHVFIYDIIIPSKVQKNFLNATTLFDLYLKTLNINVKEQFFNADLQMVSIEGSVDVELNENIHMFKSEYNEKSNALLEPFYEYPSHDEVMYEDMDEVMEGGAGTAENVNRCKDIPPEICNTTKGCFYVNGKLRKYCRRGNKTEKIANKCKGMNEVQCSTQEDCIFTKGLKRYCRKGTKKNVKTLVNPTINLEISPGNYKTQSSSLSNLQSPYLSSSISNSPLSNPMSYEELKDYIQKYFSHCKWDKVKIENTCGDQDVPVNSVEYEEMKLSSIRPKTYTEEKTKKQNTPRRATYGGSTVIQYTPTQQFISEYFTPSVFTKGMLLWHSVGTGKTCSAIATATKNFESSGYTILWVTRATLKSDIWKNMFDQICNESIRKKVQQGFKMPVDSSKRMSLLSKAWSIRPLSYKQFTNLVSKNNQYYHDLVKKNGEEDPLRKTLLVIDEAHKLYGGGDLSGQERPNMEELKQAIMKSYILSGKDSVRLLLMTATPITEGPMELIKLLNLCKLPEDQMPETFEQFSDEYLTEEGVFSPKGKTKYLNDITGILSYLNREFDIRQFSQPVIRFVFSNMINNKLIEQFDTSDMKANRENRKLIKAQIDKLILEKKMKIKQITYKEKDLKHLYEKCDKLKTKTKKNNFKTCKQDVKEMIKKFLKDIIELYTQSIDSEIELVKEATKDQVKGDKKLNKTGSYYKYLKSVYYNLLDKCKAKITSTTYLISTQPFLDSIAQLKEEIKLLTTEIKEIKANPAAVKEIKAQIVVKKQFIKENEKNITQEKHRYKLLLKEEKNQEKAKVKKEKMEMKKIKKVDIEDNEDIQSFLDVLKDDIDTRIEELENSSHD